MAKKKEKVIDYTFKTNFCKVSEQTVIWAAENHLERQLIFFLQFKRNYQNGYIKSPESRYKEFGQGMSKTTYRRRINQLVSMGWAVRNNRGVSLIALNKLPVSDNTKYNRFIYLDNDSTLTVTLLRNLISVISQRTQECKLKLSKAHFEKCQMLISVNGALTKTLQEPNRDVSLSVETLASKMKRNRSTALRQLSKARKLGIISTNSRYVLDPTAILNYKVFEGQRYRRVANQFSTVFNFRIKQRIDLSKLSKDEKIISMYCNDCF